MPNRKPNVAVVGHGMTLLLSDVCKFTAMAALLAIFVDAVIGHAMLWGNDPHWTYWITDTLLTAAARANGSVLPLPKSLKADEKTLKATLRRMLKSGLLVEQPATGRGTVWRDAEEGRLMLVIGEAGLRAIDSADEATGAPETGESAKRPNKAATKTTVAEATPHAGARAGSKLALVIDLLQREEGASIAEIVAATSWQAHSVRGAISGALKKKLGLVVLSEKMEGRGRVYRIGRG